MTEYEEERERVLLEESMTQGEYMRAAVDQYAAAHGAENPDHAWILSPFDTWERNPYYTGPPVRHPEDPDPCEDCPACPGDDWDSCENRDEIRQPRLNGR